MTRQQRLVGGDDRLPAFSAVSTAFLATPPSPPISSTNASIAGSLASATGSSPSGILQIEAAIFALERAADRHDLDRASAACRELGAILINQPHDRCADRAETGEPTLSGVAMKRPNADERRGLASRRERDDVVQLFQARIKERRMLRAAWRMRCSFSTSAMRTKPRRAHRTRHRATPQPRLSRPAVLRIRDFPSRGTPPSGAQANIEAAAAAPEAGAAERIHHRVTALLVGLAHLEDAVVGPVQRGGRGGLDRRERAVVEIGLHARQRRDDALIADRKAHAPAGHRIGLRHRGEFDRDVHRARHLQHRGGGSLSSK